MALNAPYTANTVIQSAQVSNDLVGLANGSNDTTVNSMTTLRSEQAYDNVAPSGIVWSGDSYGGTRNASMTAGTVYIGGVRLPVASVTARSFTASKDTYVDSDNTGTLVYTEVTNNAASPALAASSIRVAIVVTGATNIAAAASINQGQEDRVLPVASSINYSVADSLGNLICSRDPQRKLLCYRQVISNQGTFTAETDITGLNATCNVQTNRKVKITCKASPQSSVNDTTVLTRMKEGATELGLSVTSHALANASHTTQFDYQPPSVSSGSHTYKIAMQRNTGTGNVTSAADANNVAFIRVEQE